MKNILIISLLFLFISCTATKVQYVPTETTTKIEYRDSLIYIRDTITVYLPSEEKENEIMTDSSHLETRYAASDAWIDENYFLHHTLKQKGKTPIPVKVDTVFRVQFVDKYVEIPIIKEVKVDVPYIPKWCWICIFWSFACGVWLLARLWLKFK